MINARVARRRGQVHSEIEAPQMKVYEEVERVENFGESELKVEINEAQNSECEGQTLRRRGLVAR